MRKPLNVEFTTQWVTAVSVKNETTFGWASVEAAPSLAILAVITRIVQTDEGHLIKTLEPAWAAILDAISRNPNALHELTPIQLEELVAASYEKAGFDEVLLTPRSGDHGRDVIAVKNGRYSIRIIDQVKAFKAGHLVTANDVRALLGVLASDRNASKGVVTTTSDFAPLLKVDPFIAPYMPHRLMLINGKELSEGLLALRRKPPFTA